MRHNRTTNDNRSTTNVTGGFETRPDKPTDQSTIFDLQSPISKEAPVALFRRLQWTVLRPLATHLGGDERSLLRGPGMELNELREYQPGDDIRHIDWNITARTDQVYIREAHVERALDVWLLLDLSASVDWGTADCLKRERAVEFVALVGQLLGSRGNRVGALLFAKESVGFVLPANGRNHLLELLARVRETPRQASRGTTDLAGALARAGSVMRRRSMLLVVSDFLAPDGWQAQMRKLAQRHDLVAVRLRDPREFELPDVGILTLEDPETGEQMVVDTGNRRLRERFNEAARQQEQRMGDEFAKCGVDQLVLSTDSALLPPLVRFLDGRRLRQTLRAQGYAAGATT